MNSAVTAVVAMNAGLASSNYTTRSIGPIEFAIALYICASMLAGIWYMEHFYGDIERFKRNINLPGRIFVRFLMGPTMLCFLLFITSRRVFTYLFVKNKGG